MVKKILVVDDEPHIVRVVATRLQANGFNVITANNGKEAVEKAMEGKPDIIIMDVLMPIMNGFEALASLKRIPETAHIPVIFLTAKGETDSLLQAEKLGSADYLIKPFNSDELLEAVRRNL